jgi:LacI family transcriptional regulator
MSSIYNRIVDDIQQKIGKGELCFGDKLYSIDDICKYYNVSKMTSVKAVNELKGMGFIHGIRGKGLYVCNVNSAVKASTCNGKTVERIAIYTIKGPIENNSFIKWIMDGIYEECTKDRIDIRTEYLLNHGTEMPLTAPMKFNPGEGIISVCGLPFMRACTAAMEQGVQVIQVDSVVSGLRSVLTDNFRGISDILDYLTDAGHKRIIMASHFGDSQNFFNENERAYAFEHELRRRKLDGHVVIGSDFNILIKELQAPLRPTAVMFTQDAPALRFIKFLQTHGIRVPQDISVTGFDGNSQREENLEFLTTLEVNCAEMGRAAVKALFEPAIPNRSEEKIIRIPGKLVVNNSSVKVQNIFKKSK